jgi:hypothetical protein
MRFLRFFRLEGLLSYNETPTFGPMSEPKHPFLASPGDTDPEKVILWNTNADFPVRPFADPFSGDDKEEARKPVALSTEGQKMAAETGVESEMLSDFSQWLLSLKKASVRGMETSIELKTPPVSAVPVQGKEKKKKKKKKKKDKAKKGKKAAGTEKTENFVVTETMAELAARQGFLSEAVRMYEVLIERYPEKAAGYLRKIHDLKHD